MQFDETLQIIQFASKILKKNKRIKNKTTTKVISKFKTINIPLT